MTPSITYYTLECTYVKQIFNKCHKIMQPQFLTFLSKFSPINVPSPPRPPAQGQDPVRRPPAPLPPPRCGLAYLTAMRPDFPALRYRKSPFAPCECTAHPAGFLHRPPALWPHKCSQTRHGHTTGNRLRSNPYCCRKPPVLEQESVPHSRSDCCPPRSHPIPGGGLADGF